MLTGDIPVGANLLENSDFADIQGEFQSEKISGWVDADSEPLNALAGKLFAARPERGQIVRLDRDANSVESISQEFETEIDVDYVFTFDFRSGTRDSGQTASSHDVEVFWSDQSLGVFRPSDHWQTVMVQFQGDGNSGFISIREVESGSDGKGALIDNPRLLLNEAIQISNPGFEESVTDVKSLSVGDGGGWRMAGRIASEPLSLQLETIEGTENSFLNIGSTDQTDIVFRRLETEADESYLVMFDLRGDGQDASRNEMRVRWNDQFEGVFFGTDNWQTHGIIVNGSANASRLVFREPGSPDLQNSSNLGPFLDNVSVYRINPGFDSLTVDLSPQVEGNDLIGTYLEDSGSQQLVSETIALSNTALSELTGAVVQIVDLSDIGNEFISVDVGDTGINLVADAANGRIRLSGRSSIENYESVLNSIAYRNDSSDPTGTKRQIRVTIDYGHAHSSPAFFDLTVERTNDAPQIDGIANQSISVLSEFGFQVLANDPDGDSLQYSVFADGTALAPNDAQPVVSGDGFITWTPQQSGEANFRVEASDPDGLVATRFFTVESVIDQDLPSDFAPFTGERQLSSVVPDQRNAVYTSGPSSILDPNAQSYRALFNLDGGQIEVLLYHNNAPIAVNSFVGLTEDGYYDGLTFHRVTSLIGSSVDGFISQGGDPLGSGLGGPGYSFADELDPNRNFDTPGLLAMANRGVGNSTNGSQFFFNFDEDVRHLDQNHTIFGEIISGLDVLDSITKRAPGIGAADATIIRRIDIFKTM